MEQLAYFIYGIGVLVFAHCIADYPLQSDYLASTKGKSFYNLLVHCIIYSGVVMSAIVFVINANRYAYILIGAIILFSHIAIDKWKCTKGKSIIYLYIDQALHILILLLIYLLFA